MVEVYCTFSVLEKAVTYMSLERAFQAVLIVKMSNGCGGVLCVLRGEELRH